MRVYQSQRGNREPLVRELYGLGLFIREIVELTQYSEATVVHDIKCLGGSSAFPDRSKNKHNVFAAVIRRYAEIMVVFQKNEQDASETDKAIRQALRVWLREDLMLAVLHGLEFTLEELAVPVYAREWKGHARLLGAILDVHVGDPSNDLSWPYTSTKIWWYDMLAAINGGEEAIPKSRKHLGKLVVRRVLDERRATIMPIWDKSVFTQIDEMLSVLTDRERKVICERFGIAVEKVRTLEHIGSELGYTRERLRQIEAQAIRKLRA